MTGFERKVAAGRCGVSTGVSGVTALRLDIAHLEICTRDVAYDVGNGVHRGANSASKVVRTAVFASSSSGVGALDSILYEREVPGLLAVTVDDDLLIGQRCIDQPMKRHVRPLPRPVNRE